MKKKALIIIAIVIVFILTAAIIAIMFITSHFLDEGTRYFTQAQQSSNQNVFKDSLTKAILELEKSVLYGNYSVLGREKIARAYYTLGLANLYLRNNVKAKSYFNKAKTIPVNDPEFNKDLELNTTRSLVRVESIIGNGTALVNQTFVQAGDSIGSIEVIDIGNTYVVFKSGNFIFSDSINKYSPLAKKDRAECKVIFDKALKSDNPGFALGYYKLAESFAKNALINFAMDSEQSAELNLIIDKSKEEIVAIENKFKEAVEKKELISGLNKKEVTEIIGSPEYVENDDVQGMIWTYADKKLFFKDDLGAGIEGILMRWE